MNREIFRAYDIRGLYPEQLNEETAYLLGRVAVRYLDARELVVGRDMRKSGVTLFKALAEGVNDMGADVVDIGVVSTPMSYFAVANYGYPGSIVISPSHNPKEYNGFKICRRNAVPVYDKEILELADMMEAERGNKTKAATRGGVRTLDISGDYRAHVRRFARPMPKLKVVVDAANGMGGKTIPLVFDGLGLDLVPLYFELDGSFPNHDADPLKQKNLVDVKKAVVETGADLGAAIDGDADRVVFIDEKGNDIAADLVTALVGSRFASKMPGAKVIYDLRSSRVVKEAITAAGGEPVMTRVGHAFIKKLMRSMDGLYAGELSGHYYFRDNYYADNADIAVMVMLGVLSDSGVPLSELIAPFRKYFASGEINSRVADPDAKMAEIVRGHPDAKISGLDGILVEYPDWWFNVRKSNTEPLLRLNLEAGTREMMERKRDEILALIRA